MGLLSLSRLGVGQAADSNSITNPWVALAISTGGAVLLFLVWRYYWRLMDEVSRMYTGAAISDRVHTWRRRALAFGRLFWILGSIALALVSVLLVIDMATNGVHPFPK
jgi:cytochrome b561